MKWITRERPKIDRIACPWLIKNFVDAEAEFIYVPFDEVKAKAEKLKAIPFDIPDVEFTHYKDKCTFDYFIQKYQIDDPAIQTIAVIVRGADTDRHAAADWKTFRAASPGFFFAMPMGVTIWTMSILWSQQPRTQTWFLAIALQRRKDVKR